MAGTIDVRTESRALRRAELILARVREDCGAGLGALATIEPLLTRLDRLVGDGKPPALGDVERLASASRLLETVPLQAHGVDDALRNNLARELGEIAERLRPVAEPRPEPRRTRRPQPRIAVSRGRREPEGRY